LFRRIYLLLLIALIVLFTASCSSSSSVSSGTKNEQKLKSSLVPSNSTEFSLNNALTGTINIKSPQDLTDKSKQIGSTPGRLALAMIINKLDNATVVEDLSKKTSKDLFDLLRQDAPQKSQTLEGLDQLYGLNSILASEGIFVDFQANNVVSATSSGSSSSAAWEDKFIQAINNTSSD
jgi:hypothetical protein